MIRKAAIFVLLVGVSQASAQDLRAGDYEAAATLDGVEASGSGQLRAHPRWSGKYGLRLRLGTQAPVVLQGHAVPDGVLFVFPPMREGIVGRLGGDDVELTHATVLVKTALRLRDAPSFASGVPARARPGLTFRVLARQGEWVQLQAASHPVWGHRDYLVDTTGPSSARFLRGRRTALLVEQSDGSLRGTVREGEAAVGELVLLTDAPRPTPSSDGVTFAAIDLTPDIDARDFVRRAKGFGLQNLMEQVPGGRDVAHPRMSLQGGVVSPYGRVYWKSEEDSETGQPYELEVSPFVQDQCQENIRTARDWITQPGIRVSADGRRGQLLGSPAEDGVTVEGEARYADFLFISSHGYTDGEIRGAPRFADWVRPKNMFESAPYRPFDPQLLKVTSLTGTRWTNGKTRYAMLALCNVLRREYWHDWASALLDPNGMRGVLGYDSGSPKPDGTTIINRRFFAACARGLSIVQAWKAANEEAKIFSWCAIVREDALQDTLSDWVRTGDLPPREANTRVLYFSFKRSERHGVPVADSGNPTPRVRIDWSTDGQPITKANGRLGGGLVPGLTYELQVSDLPRPLRDDDKVLITFVNIRENYWHGPGRHELDLEKMFEFEQGAVIDTKKKHQPRMVDTVVMQGRDRLSFTLEAGDEGLLSQVKADEAYLWVQVSVRDGRNVLVAEGTTMSEQLVVRKEGTNPFGQ